MEGVGIDQARRASWKIKSVAKLANQSHRNPSQHETTDLFNGRKQRRTRGSKVMPKILMDDESQDVPVNGELNGRYANYFTVGHNAFEFLFDFGQLDTQGWPAPVHTRIITTPAYAKSLLGILQESVDQYEQMFGTIPEGDK
jgi:uncharacterized protein DUF3467